MHARRTLGSILVAIAAPLALAQTNSQGDSAGDVPAIDRILDSTDPGEEASDSTFSLRARTEWIFPADLDADTGEVTISRVSTGFDASFAINDRSRLAVSLGEELSFYDFSDTMILSSGVDPFDDISETDLAVSYSLTLDDDWSLFTSAIVRASAESGADFGDSLSYAGLSIASYRVSDSLTLGGGVLVRTRLEDDVLVLPAATIDWQINDRWRLSNTGSSAGVRLTLAHQFDDDWTFFGDVGYEGREFRLDDNGPIPGGVARDLRLPVALGATYAPNDNLTIQARVGVHFLQSLQLDNSAGDELADIDIDPAGFLAIVLSLRM